MSRQEWKPCNLLYPLPAVMVTARSKEGQDNIITIAWAGIICTNPHMVSISVSPLRYSYSMIKESGEFVINLTTEALTYAVDYCGVKSGRVVDKFKEMKLHKLEAAHVNVSMIEESPVNIECRVTQASLLGSHHMFMAEVLAVHVDTQYMDASGKFSLEQAKPIVYSHGQYYGLGNILGSFGYSVRKKSLQGGRRHRKKR